MPLNVRQSTYDQGLFYCYSAGKLEDIMVCFVDDQLWGGSSDFETKVIKNLRTIFDIHYEHSSAFKYVGIDLKQYIDGSISNNQERDLQSINTLIIDRDRGKNKYEEVTVYDSN